ncbi:MAG: hypothetical protein IPM23_18685 [Candidatus Melainabacteria bacterium]|nr:hypothetical protein [Candidatus Melainabacteria bacterium]
MNAVALSPEIIRLAQIRARENGLSLDNELARLVVEELVMSLDPELDLILEPDLSLNALDSLAFAIGANDLVLNGKHIDIRAMDDTGRVSLDKALIGSPLLAVGTLVVKFDSTACLPFSARVVAHIPPGSWLSGEETGDRISVAVEADPNFDLEAVLKSIDARVQIPLDRAVSVLPDEAELATFVNDRKRIVASRQKQIITALCAKHEIRDLAREVPVDCSRKTLNDVLKDGATWNRRTEEMAVVLAPKFKSLTKEEVKKAIVVTGETYGGQPEAPEFRKAAIKTLTRAQLERVSSSARVKAIAEQVLAGKSVMEAVKGLVKSSVAVDIASAIKTKRGKVENFVAATAEEIGFAIKQLSLQPAYATHSTKKEAGVESINEALELLSACQILEDLDSLEREFIES